MRDRVTEYAQAVVDGKVPFCGRLHILACKRHLNDLKKQRTEKFPYYWSVEAADRILEYAETLTIKEGFEQKPVRLFDCQAFDIGCTFGWLRCADDFRRFRRRYKSVSRQQGKSFENGIMGPYIAAFGGYQEGKLFTAATKRRQAKIVWDEMRKFIQSDSELSEYFSIKEYSTTITALNTGCTIEALSKEGGLDDGFRGIFNSVDELHQHKDNSIYSALWKGTRNLPETLLSVITTRGKNPRSFCKEFDDFCVSVLEGTVTADDIFVDIYTPDEGDDIWDINNMLKANPLFVGNPEKIKALAAEAENAKNMGGMEKIDFIVKSLNMWSSVQDKSYVKPNDLMACATDKSIESFRGCECWVGLDLSSGGDLTTIALEFDDGGKDYFFAKSYMPRGRFQEHIENDFAPYDMWEREGLIKVTGDEMSFKNDYKFIIADLKRFAEEYGIKYRAIGVDPHNADGFIADLEAFGCPVVLVKQSARSLNSATVDIRLNVKSHNVEFDKNNEMLIYSFENAVVVENSFKEIKIEKRDFKNGNRIDPVDACIDAHFCKMMARQETPVDPNEMMEDYLKEMGW
ncbi:terminase large subunit [Ruminococcus sp.]|uniref:terminase large subunit n=1 Tax=Ruminococcus sp. TaxID=41978 RepID=UPI002E7625BD|nr:terminase TerL endonuclease subunit [Ruminococcus sp.]MEE1263498.1 terminase TerL endonuclease subunit [Ruminococcus sp.]